MIEATSATPDRAAFLEELDRATERAAKAAGGFEDHYFDIAGFVVRLRFAGPALVPRLARALAHLRRGPSESPSLSIRLWDSDSTGTPMPPPPWGVDDYREQGIIRGYFGNGVYSMFRRDTKSLTVLDTDRDEGVYWVNRPAREGFPEAAAPLHSFFQLWMGKRDVQLVHAGAVGTPDGCVLIVGSGGAGKSSTALACLDSDLGFISDDYCLVGPGRPPTVWSLYSSGQSLPDTLERLPFLSEMVSNPSRSAGEKALHFVHECRPEKLTRSAPLRAIAIPRVGGRPETTASRASAAAALTALAPSTLFQMPGTGQPTLRRLARIVDAVPSYVLDLGTHRIHLTRALEDLLASP